MTHDLAQRLRTFTESQYKCLVASGNTPRSPQPTIFCPGLVSGVVISANGVTFNPKHLESITEFEIKESLLSLFDPTGSDKTLAFYAGFKQSDSSISRKVQKLMALSSSPNEAEASLALSRAQELIAKYGVHAKASYEFVWRSLGRKPCGYRTKSGCELSIGGILGEYGVEAILFPTATLDGRSAWITIAHGRPEDIDVADYIADYLRQLIKTMWVEYKRQTGARGRSDKDSYQKGLLFGFHRKLRDSTDNPASPGLIRVANSVEKWVQELYPKLKASSVAPPRSQTFYDGDRHGAEVKLRKGVTCQNQALLPG